MTLVYVVMLLCCRTVYGYDRNDYVMATHRGSALSAGQTVTLEVADAAACRAYCWQHADCAAAAYSRQAGCVTFLQPPDLYDVERRNTSTLWVKEKLQLGDHLLNDTKCYQEQFLIVCKGASTIKIYHTQFLFLRACGAGDRPTAGPRPPGQETCPASGDEFEGRVDWVSARCDGLTACGGGGGDLTAKMLRYKQDSTGCPWSSSTNAEVVYYTCVEAAGRQQGGASGAAGGAVLVGKPPFLPLLCSALLAMTLACFTVS